MAVGAVDHAVPRSAILPLLAVCIGLSSAACDIEACDGLDLRASTPRDKQSGAVVAIGEAGLVKIIRACADESDCNSKSSQVDLDTKTKPDQLMLTASGRWLAYRSGRDVFRVDLESCVGTSCSKSPAVLTAAGADELIGTLRGGDWLIYRSSGQLRATYVGDDELVAAREFRLGEGLDWKVVAMGHRHIVARTSRGDGTEELYLITIAPARKVDELAKPGEVQPLATGPAFGRVLLTEGPSPSDQGHPSEFQHHVPTDEFVIASSGHELDARTLIYAVADRSLKANFPGEVVTKYAALEDVPGLSAVSPDGSHLAFIRRDGSLALRNLDSQGTCLVRSASRSTHLLAGFAADATLYFEAEHEQNPQVESVHAYDPLTGVFTDLIDPAYIDDDDDNADSRRVNVWRLKAVPQRFDDSPWAIIGLDDGDYIVHEGSSAKVDHDEVSFLPRSEGDIWMLDGDGSRIDLSSVLPRAALEEPVQARLPFSLASTSTVCVTTSQSTSRTTPWATRCASASEAKQYLSSGLPEGEQGP